MWALLLAAVTRDVEGGKVHIGMITDSHLVVTAEGTNMPPEQKKSQLYDHDVSRTDHALRGMRETMASLGVRKLDLLVIGGDSHDMHGEDEPTQETSAALSALRFAGLLEKHRDIVKDRNLMYMIGNHDIDALSKKYFDILVGAAAGNSSHRARGKTAGRGEGKGLDVHKLYADVQKFGVIAAFSENGIVADDFYKRDPVEVRALSVDVQAIGVDAAFSTNDEDLMYVHQAEREGHIGKWSDPILSKRSEASSMAEVGGPPRCHPP